VPHCCALTSRPGGGKRAVLAQLAGTYREHFPLLIFDNEPSAISHSPRFKIVAGTVEQMAGVAFRIQDEKLLLCAGERLGHHVFTFSSS